MLAKAKIVKGGKISVPAIYRKSLNLKRGDEMVFNLNDNELTLTSYIKLVNKYEK